MFLNESLLAGKKTEISYISAMKQFQSAINTFKELVSKKPELSSLSLLKGTFPSLYVFSKYDYRVTMQLTLTEPWSIRGLVSNSKFTERAILNAINDIYNEFSYTYTDISLGICQFSQNEYIFLLYLDGNKCLKNIISESKLTKKVPSKDITTEMKNEKDKIILNIKKHPLGKKLAFDKTYDNKLYFSPHLNGVKSSLFYLLQDPDKDSFFISDFKNEMCANANTYMVGLHLAYYIEETYLNNSNISLLPINLKDGSCVMILTNKNYIRVLV